MPIIIKSRNVPLVYAYTHPTFGSLKLCSPIPCSDLMFISISIIYTGIQNVLGIGYVGQTAPIYIEMTYPGKEPNLDLNKTLGLISDSATCISHGELGTVEWGA